MRIFGLALRRLAASIPTLFLILAGLFLLLQLAPARHEQAVGRLSADGSGRAG